ncbi:MAG: 4-(cytidine 5'-diphospho)-2-C-methyl-D-erythritol kinase [Ruminococcaceae bacterium]|nr:4-(cytidine 5'-diphospho)-2-C-methyl-D-erythritol kinase [Oscillospiraceae bacterium]
MNQIVLPSRAKINLSLLVLGKRSDGYHNIKSLMQTVEFGDEVTIRLRDDDSIYIESNLPELPVDERNIVYRAAVLMKQTFQISQGFSIYINKRIPVAAGLAGGSGNAAATLRGIDQLCGLNLSEDKLAALGLTLGADVPFCLYGKPALAEGIGERLTPAVGLTNCYIVLVNPGVGVSTGMIYQALDDKNVPFDDNTEQLLSALKNGDIKKAVYSMNNMMETVAINYCPAISNLLTRLLEAGALHAMMSGSGATCFGVFTEQPDAVKLQQLFGDELVAITRPVI